MSLFDDDRYSWRETYFVFFEPAKRPRLRTVRRELDEHAGTFRVLDQQATEEGKLERLVLASYEDHSALEIIYHEGKGVAGEAHALVESLLPGCTAKEAERLGTAKRCRAKFDILHFEQTAGTAEFKIIKMPDLTFAPKKDALFDSGRGRFPKEQSFDKLPTGERFHFDPNSYDNCRTGHPEVPLDYDSLSMEDSGIIERIDPNTLVLVLETLCRTSDGVAIDPASGVVI